MFWKIGGSMQLCFGCTADNATKELNYAHSYINMFWVVKRLEEKKTQQVTNVSLDSIKKK